MVDILVREINAFDCYYEMSDDDSIYNQGESNRRSINSRVKQLTVGELALLVDSLNNVGRVNYNRYFKS